jgi:lysozyme
VDDPLHDRNIRELKAAGIICGDYYYYHPSIGAAKQARHYAAIRARNEPDLPPIIDIEDADGMKPADVSKQLLAFIDELHRRTCQFPVIYSRNGFLVNQCGNPDWPPFTHFWIARYGLTIGDLSPNIKPNVIIWQYTDKLKIPGCPVMDGNVWMASDEEFFKFINQEFIITPLDPTKSMWRYLRWV